MPMSFGHWISPRKPTGKEISHMLMRLFGFQKQYTPAELAEAKAKFS